MRAFYLYRQSDDRSFRIEEGHEVSLGRAFDNSIYTEDTSVSRHHAVIKWKKGSVYIADLGSTNGTFLNDERVQVDLFYEIHYFDEVKIGNVAFRLVDEASVLNKNAENKFIPAKTVALNPGNQRNTLNKKDFEKKP